MSLALVVACSDEDSGFESGVFGTDQPYTIKSPGEIHHTVNKLVLRFSFLCQWSSCLIVLFICLSLIRSFCSSQLKPLNEGLDLNSCAVAAKTPDSGKTPRLLVSVLGLRQWCGYKPQRISQPKLPVQRQLQRLQHLQHRWPSWGLEDDQQDAQRRWQFSGDDLVQRVLTEAD